MLLQVVSGDFLEMMEERAGDIVWRLSDSSQRERRIVIVDIDEKSLQQVGPWPWRRDQLADLIEGLNHYEPALRMMDIVVPDEKVGDDRLAAALARSGPIVWSQLFSLDPAVTITNGALGKPLPIKACPSFAPVAHGYIGNSPSLALAAGHITPWLDADGAIRRVPALVCYQGAVYPSLPLAGWMLITNSELSIQATGLMRDPDWTLSFPGFPGVTVPLDAQGRQRVSYRIPRDGFLAVSAVAVMQRKLDPELLRGAWVLVGATAFGVSDAVPTPQGGAVGGVEVHAQILSALLDQRSPYTPRGAPAIVMGMAVLAMLLLLLTAAVNRKKALFSLPLLALLLIGMEFVLHAGLLLGQALWVGWLQPAMFTLLTAIALATAELVRFKFERERIYANLSSYLSEPVARAVSFKPATPEIEASLREATVLVADLRNFATYCSAHTPMESAQVLHGLFANATRIVEDSGGVVLQMSGNGLLAAWNALQPCGDHSQRAVEAATQIFTECGAVLPRDHSDAHPMLGLGVGVETGEILVGSFGASHRRTHTILGEAVTAATALERMTEEMAYPVLLGPAIAARVTDPRQRELGTFLLDGVHVPRQIFALDLPLELDRIQQVLDDDALREDD